MTRWIPLTSEEQLAGITVQEQYSLIFKHSTRCPVSSMVKKMIALEEPLIPDEIPCYYLDLIRYRSVSDRIADTWQVKHESPQLLLVKGSECLHHASHNDIHVADFITRVGTM